MRVKRGFRRRNTKSISRTIVKSGSKVHPKNHFVVSKTPRGGIRL